VLCARYHSGDEIRKYEMGGACGTYGEGSGAYRVWWGKLREGDPTEDLDVDGSII